jgi:mannose-6-phosphate isomerase-like protein (cupin superfamily)
MKPPEPLLDAVLAVQLAEQQTPLLPAAAVAARLKARILDAVRAQVHPGDAGLHRPHDPAPLALGASPGPITLRAAEGVWVHLTPKVEVKLLRADGDSRSFLLRLQPGAVLPPHEHPVEEECLCLEGEVRFGDLVVRAGDYHLAPRGVPHGVVRSRTGALLYLRGANPPAVRAE